MDTMAFRTRTSTNKSVRSPKWRSRSRRTSAERVFVPVLVFVSERGVIFSDYFVLLPQSVLGIVN